MPRTFAVGDIHGCHVAFDVLLSHLELAADDTLVVLGDFVDRGPGTRQVIDRLLELDSRCRLIVLMGNHEEMMLEALFRRRSNLMWLQNGGLEVLESYGGVENIPRAHVEFVQNALNWWETDTEIYVHAKLQPGFPLAIQTPDYLRWFKLTGTEPPHPSGRRVICGHTPQLNGLPLVFEGWVCLDTAACRGGWLTALDVATNEFCQARQDGTYRGGLSLERL